MTSDDLHFLDALAGVSSDVVKFTANSIESIFDSTERAVNSVADGLKDAVRQAGPWIGLRRPPDPPLPPAAPQSYYERAVAWASRHRAVVAAVVAFFGTGAVYIYAQRRYRGRKRRARRAASGARKEVVVVAGPPGSPITKSLALDLERRGFIVYVLVSSAEEEALVQSEARTDIRPFHMDVVDPVSGRQAMERFNSLLRSQHHAFAGAVPHALSFTGLVIAPDLQYISGPVETLCPELWSDVLNAKVLHTIATAQAFLPAICEFKSRVVVLTPAIVSSLKPPFHGMENAVISALEGFTVTLQRELITLGIHVCHMKLGTFDCSNAGARNHLQASSAARTTAWPASARTLYARNFLTQGRIAEKKGLFGETGSAARGSPLRQLHHAVFDALTQPNPRKTWRFGRGSLAYDIIGAWVPSGVVGWMLGIRRVRLEETAGPQLEDSEQHSWEKVERTSP